VTVGDASTAADSGADATAGAEAANTAGANTDTAEAATAAGAGTDTDANAAAVIDGLPRDANGLFYFELDGSGRPFEARIDIPLAEFEDLYFDGQLWARGTDYEAREGSTLLTVAAEKLAGFAYGAHEIAAHFTGDRVVSISFELRGSAAEDGAAGIGATENGANEARTADAETASKGAASALIAGAAVVALLLAAAFILRARRRA
jgi:hypothetical protein